MPLLPGPRERGEPGFRYDEALPGLMFRSMVVIMTLTRKADNAIILTMPLSAPPNHTNLADQLPAEVYYQLIHSLCPTLPPPLTDSPEDLARRNHSAIARIAALCPANAAEADTAALYVAASEQWKKLLRLAEEADTTSYWAQKCRAQANSMMRQANSALRLLLRMQAAREKREANNEARDRATWTEHCAIGLMMQALSPHPQPAATAEPPPPPAPKPRPQPQPAKEPQPALRAAEHDTAVSPQRAALLRLMETLNDPPPDGDLVQSLIAALLQPPTTPDRQFAEACKA